MRFSGSAGVVVAGCAVLTMVVALAARSQTSPAAPASPSAKPPAAPAATPQPQAPEHQAMIDAATPGAAHEQLAKLAGEWTTTTAISFQGTPAGAPEAGTATIRTTLGGRFIEEEHQGTMMGDAVTIRRMLGYNNATKKYEGVWAYTMSTALMTLRGSSNDDGKTIAFDAAFDNEVGEREELTVVMTIDGPDAFTIKLTGGEGANAAGVEMVTKYTRKK